MTDPSTVRYDIYKHVDSDSDCGVPGLALQQPSHRDVCPSCRQPVTYVRTELVRDELPSAPYSRDMIASLPNYERTLFLGMVMESIRGNCTVLTDRLGIIGAIVDIGVGEYLDDSFLDATERRAKRLYHRKRITYAVADGRDFRGTKPGTYGALWEQVETDPGVMRELARYIPNDWTWTNRRFRTLDGEQGGGPTAGGDQ